MKQTWSSGTVYLGLLFALGSSLASCATLEQEVPATPLAPSRPTAAEEKSRMVTAVTNSGPVIQDLKPLVDKTAAFGFREDRPESRVRRSTIRAASTASRTVA